MNHSKPTKISLQRRAICQAGILALLPIPMQAAELPAHGLSRLIRVERVGAGREVVFVAGFGASADVWSGCKTALGRNTRVHLVHVAGFAEEPATAIRVPGFISGLGTAIANYIARRRLVRPLLVVHSGAAAVAMSMALDHPSLLAGMMVVDGLPFPAELELGADATVEQAITRATQTYEAQRRMARVDYAAERASEARDSVVADEDAQRVAQWAIRSDRALLMQADRELSSLDLRDRISVLATPLTVVFADQASSGAPPGWMNRIYERQYARMQSPRQMVEIASARHFLMLDQPQAFATALRQFTETTR